MLITKNQLCLDFVPEKTMAEDALRERKSAETGEEQDLGNTQTEILTLHDFLFFNLSFNACFQISIGYM